MKPYAESLIYLKTVSAVVESMSEKTGNKDKNYIKTNIGILNDVKDVIQKLIVNLQKMDR
tara:strand:- start:21499 stop:21678 length:180 start_codon:yes stop_codon:yes gene_type:complete